MHKGEALMKVHIQGFGKPKTMCIKLKTKNSNDPNIRQDRYSNGENNFGC